MSKLEGKQIPIPQETMISGKSEARQFRERMVKQNLDLLILGQAEKGSVTGYNIMTLVHERYRFLISSGNVYGMLYSLERRGFLKGEQKERRRAYTITDEGKAFLASVRESRELDLRKLLF